MKTTLSKIEKRVSEIIGAPVSIITATKDDGRCIHAAWIRTDEPRARREALTPKLARLLGGRAIDLQVLFSGGTLPA